jgi:hypothetical protein
MSLPDQDPNQQPPAPPAPPAPPSGQTDVVPAAEVEKRVAGFHAALSKKDEELAAARKLNTDLQSRANALETQVREAQTERERAVTTLTTKESELTTQLQKAQQDLAERDARINSMVKKDQTVERIESLNKDLVPFYKKGFLTGVEDLEGDPLKAKLDEFKETLTGVLNPVIQAQRAGQTTNPPPAGAPLDLASMSNDDLRAFVMNYRQNGKLPHYDAARVEWTRRNKPSTQQNLSGK